MTKFWFTLLFGFSWLIAQDKDLPGYIKTLTDPLNNRQYSNIASDSLKNLFYEVIYDRDLIFEGPEKNAEATGALTKNSLVEYLDKDDGGKYFKIRQMMGSGSLQEGWVRRKSLGKEKFYGRSLLSKPDTLKLKERVYIEENELNPHWLLADQTPVYADSLLQVPLKVFGQGEQLFVHRQLGAISEVVYLQKPGAYQRGYLHSDRISPFLVLPGVRPVEELLKTVDLGVLEYDLIKSGFVNYLILEVTGDTREDYVEDKVCRERKGDTVSYKQSFTNNPTKINKFFTRKGAVGSASITGFRILPDQMLKMGLDSINSRVVELTYKPHTALITVDGVEDGFIENRVTRLNIIHLDKFNADLVFHREENIYNWKFRYDKNKKNYLSKKYRHTVRNRRLVRLNLEKEK